MQMHKTDYSGESEENYSMRSDPPLLYETYEDGAIAVLASNIEAVDVSSSIHKAIETESDTESLSLKG